jgi:replicative DNA helicase
VSVEKIAPQNLDAEESVLSAIMLAGIDGPEASKALVATVTATGLESRDFSRDSHGAIYAG